MHAITGEYLRRISTLLCEANSPIGKRGTSRTGNAELGLLVRAAGRCTVALLVKLPVLCYRKRKVSESA
jgi:hypothetical protein